MKTYETKIKDDSAVDFIRRMNQSFGQWSRKLFVKLYANPSDDRNKLKRDFQRDFGVSSTHYNSLKNHVDGMYRSRRELGKTQSQELKSRIKYTHASIRKLEKSKVRHRESIARILCYHKDLDLYKNRKAKGLKSRKPRALSRSKDKLTIQEQRSLLEEASFKIHQKKRRLNQLEEKYSRLEQRIKEDSWKICFGSRKQQQKQNFTSENGYRDHAAWKDDWQFLRSNQSYWLGDTNEKARNRNAKLNLSEGSIRLTVPQSLRSEFGSFVTVNGLNFHKTAEADIRAALESEDPAKKSALSFRLLERQKISCHKNGDNYKRRQLYLQVSLDEEKPEVTTSKNVGCIGVDLNSDHLAASEVDRFGNPIQAFHLPIDMAGKSSQQISAVFGNHIRDIVLYAKLKGKPISVEKLDFQHKKSALRETCGRKMARLLSSFAYKKFMQMTESRCQREGVKLLKVNPAFSSVLGAYNYIGLAHLYSSHQMAGFILARRGLGFQDSLKCVYNERNHTTLLQTVSIAPEKAPPTFDAWIEGGGKRHRWSLLRRYYGTFSLFVKHLGSKHSKTSFRYSQVKRNDRSLSPPGFGLSLV